MSTKLQTSRALRPAAFFDLDKTIIASNSAAAFNGTFYRRGLITNRDMLAATYVNALYLLGRTGEDQTTRLRDNLSQLVKGWSVPTVNTIIADTLDRYINPQVYKHALDLIAAHHASGHDVVIVSASATEIVTPIARLVGADHVLATRMEIADDTYTGNIEFYCYGPNKAEAVSQIARERGYDLSTSFAYSDSVSDLPLLELVGNPRVVNPDRQLRARALAEDWTIFTFRKSTPVYRTVLPWAILGLTVFGASLGAYLTWRFNRRPKA